MYRGLVLLWPHGEKYGLTFSIISMVVWVGRPPGFGKELCRERAEWRGGRSLEIFGQENLEDRVFLLIWVGGEGDLGIKL